LKLGVTKFKIIGRRIGWHAEPFTGPSTEVSAFAAFTAKGAKRVAAGINAVALAVGASDVPNFDLKRFRHGNL
jgi:hypothetical protein